MTEFFIEIGSDEFEPGLCFRSGQVFRFDEVGPQAWAGAEGSNWYVVRRFGDRLTVQSNAGPPEFSSFARLDWNAKAVAAEIVASGPEMAPYLAAAPGLRVLRQSDPVEVLFTFLCTANNHVARIGGMVRSLASYGEPFSDADLDRFPVLRRFPELERLAEIGEAELRAKGFGYRAVWIAKTACELIERGGRPWLDALKGLGCAEAHKELTGLTGVGPKLADCIALFGLDQTSAVPVDTHVWQAAVRNYFPQYAGTAFTTQKYREVAAFFQERFGERAGWAHQFLFLDNHLNWRERRAGQREVEVAGRRAETGGS